MIKRGSRGRPPHDDVLTRAEWRVVEAVRHGMTNPQIAKRQEISLDAVKFHVGNALQKLNLGSRIELRHWTGVRRDSALKRGERPVNAPVQFGPLGQVSRTVADISAAERWYREVLALPHLYTFGKLAFFDMGGVRLYLTEGEGKQAESVLYFRVSDIHAAHRDLSGRGVTFANAPHLVHRHGDGTEEWMAFFNDNEGRTLAIMAQVPATSTSDGSDRVGNVVNGVDS